MKHLFLSLVAVLALASIGFAYTGGLDYFSARTDGDGISVEWKSGVETGVQSYTIQRSDIQGKDYTDVGTVTASGSYNYYKYRDAHVSSMPVAGQTNVYRPLGDLYKYRLQMNYASEISYSQTISVSRPSSGVKRTWGMIKEMFH